MRNMRRFAPGPANETMVLVSGVSPSPPMLT